MIHIFLRHRSPIFCLSPSFAAAPLLNAWPWAVLPSRRQLNSHHSQLKGWRTSVSRLPGLFTRLGCSRSVTAEGTCQSLWREARVRIRVWFPSSPSELRTGFSYFCTKLQKLSSQPVASLQLQEIQLWALTYSRDSVITVTEKVSFWQVGFTWWHLCEALEMTSAVV